MVIADATIVTDIFKSIRSKLVGGLTGVSVKAVYDDSAASRPQVVITPVSVNEGFDKFGGSEGRKNINVIIMTYAQTPLALDTLTDQVRVLLKANDINGMDLIGIDEDYAFNNSLEDKFHSKTLSCAYLRE